jgi:hypothetical protein
MVARVNVYIGEDLSSQQTEFGLRRREWVRRNRFRATQRRCAYLLHKWGFCD